MIHLLSIILVIAYRQGLTKYIKELALRLGVKISEMRVLILSAVQVVIIGFHILNFPDLVMKATIEKIDKSVIKSYSYK